MFDGDAGVEEALATLERERAKIGKLSELWREGRTTVRAKDQSLSMTFDGRGEVVDLVFNESKYRLLAPAQLANVVVETLQRGKAECMAKMSEVMGAGSASGIDYGEVASGKVDPQQVLESLIGPMLGSVGLERRDGGRS
ncbi:YbaB/EbfC family DNA-binding protein [Amycolatopsis mongoliensis]|uniref:YbaB/EbfC family DNA-binding protein n=1 Tax=Amycolatopsis mongoliensis TaxID=715475 RepID=A0A9Y2JI94_9PSEU|nr:YbaB/EbfC family nucleoid-associated protein [Amycolatopsis sp. 4-36]WIX98209.1 YbaB/EbfC family DNA-binding protein [Amycolatopsis sp. 4-36]